MTLTFEGTIRPLVATDKEAVEHIFDLYWSGDFRRRLAGRLSSDAIRWFVAEVGGEVVGVAGYRAAPERMSAYCTTDHAAEFYVSAVKHKGRGIGTALREARIRAARAEGYKEAVFFSAVSHKESWVFHDSSAFVRVTEAVAPDGESGMVWRMLL